MSDAPGRTRGSKGQVQDLWDGSRACEAGHRVEMPGPRRDRREPAGKMPDLFARAGRDDGGIDVDMRGQQANQSNRSGSMSRPIADDRQIDAAAARRSQSEARRYFL